MGPSLESTENTELPILPGSVHWCEKGLIRTFPKLNNSSSGYILWYHLIQALQVYFWWQTGHMCRGSKAPAGEPTVAEASGGRPRW